ncbi:MAG TPA: TonB-dependent receptor [Bryobacteraceae bacterium]
MSRAKLADACCALRPNRGRTLVWPLTALLLSAAITAADGQEAPPSGGPAALKTLSLEQLSKIEITTVTKESRAAFTTPAAIYVLTREDIARSGATNLPDLLRLVPGVDVAQIASDKWAIGIRGFQGYLSKSVLVLIDGRSVYTPLFAGVYWEMQDTVIEDIDRIEVIRGPGGTIWGANAVNGVINIITKSAKETRGEMVKAGGGNVEQGFLSMRYGAGGDNLSYRVYGKGFTRGPQYHPDGRNFDDWRSARAGFRVDWTPSARDSVTLSGDAYQEYAGSKNGISTYSPPALINVEANGDFSGQNFVGAWRRTFRSGSDIELRVYFDRTDRNDLNYREIRDTVDIDFIHHIPRGSHDVTWGGGIRVSPSRFFQTVPTVDFLPHKETYSIFSGFVQDSITLAPNRLTATLGSKIEDNSYSGFEYQPSGRLAWTPTEQQTVWASVTRALRTPSRIEQGFRYTALAVPALPLYLRLIGDGQFDPEQLAGYELGYRTYIKNAGFISIAGFYNRYDNLLSVENQPLAPESTPEPAHLVLPLYLRNGIAAQTKGVEISSLWDLKSWWRVKPSYSYLHLNAERYPTSDDASTVGQVQGDSPQHKVVVQSLFTLPRAFDLDLTYRYVGSLPDLKVPSYSTGDVRLARKLTSEIELAVVGQNLLQPHHAEYGGLPGGLVYIRRSAFVRLMWTR